MNIDDQKSVSQMLVERSLRLPAGRKRFQGDEIDRIVEDIQDTHPGIQDQVIRTFMVANGFAAKEILVERENDGVAELHATDSGRKDKQMKFVNLLEKSEQYRDNPRLTDETRRIHQIILEGIWDEYMNGEPPAPREPIYQQTLDVLPNLSNPNFFNYLGQVTTMMDYYFGEKKDRQVAVKRLKNDATSALLLKRMIEGGFKTREDFFGKSPAKAGAKGKKRNTKKKNKKPKVKKPTRPPRPKSPSAPNVSRQSLTLVKRFDKHIAALNKRIESLTANRDELSDARERLKDSISRFEDLIAKADKMLEE